MESVSGTEALVKLKWEKEDSKWFANLLTIENDKFKQRRINKGDKLDIEIINERRCVGYSGSEGREVCSDFRRIEEGRRCYSCRQKDSNRDYIEGRSGHERKGNHSVYLVQIGDRIKVGVTRTDRLMNRWVEQGAIYGTEIMEFNDASEALNYEAELSDRGINERINKKQKSMINDVGNEKLKNIMNEIDIDGEILDVQSRTAYSDEFPEIKAKRRGKFTGEIRTVRGQLIYTENQCLAVTTSLSIQEPNQTSITDF